MGLRYWPLLFPAALLSAVVLTRAPARADCYRRSYYRPYRDRVIHKVRIRPVAVAVYAPFAVQVPAYGASYNPGYGAPPPGVLPAQAQGPAYPAAQPAAAAAPCPEVLLVLAELRKLTGRMDALERRAGEGPVPRSPGPDPATPAPRKAAPREEGNDDDEARPVMLAHAAARCAACHTEGGAPKGDFVLFRKGAPEKLAALVKDAGGQPLPRLEKALNAALGKVKDDELAKLEDESFADLDADALDKIVRYTGRGKCPPPGNDRGVPVLSDEEKKDWAAWAKEVKSNLKKAAARARKGRGMRFVRRDL